MYEVLALLPLGLMELSGAIQETDRVSNGKRIGIVKFVLPTNDLGAISQIGMSETSYRPNSIF